jgi:hypothetical protein
MMNGPEWVLFFWIGMGGGSADFADQRSCEAAMVRLKTADSPFVKGGICAPKSDGPWLCDDGSTSKKVSDNVYQCPAQAAKDKAE